VTRGGRHGLERGDGLQNGDMSRSRSYPPSGSSLSLWSKDSFLSIGSVGSVLSIGSVGSALSLGSVGSWLSAGSVGSALSLLSLASYRSMGSAFSSESRWAFGTHRSHGATLVLLGVGSAALAGAVAARTRSSTLSPADRHTSTRP